MASQANRGLSRQVLAYLKQYPNQNVDIDDIAAALHVDVKSVSGSVSTLKANGYDIARPHHGVAVYRPSVSLTAGTAQVTQQRRFEDFIRSNPYVELTSDEITGKLGFTQPQISTVVYQMRKKGFTINSPLQGVYIYVPTAEQVESVAAPVVEVPASLRPLLADPDKIAAREAEVNAYVEDERHPVQAPPAPPRPVVTTAPSLSTVVAGQVAVKSTKLGSHLYEEIGVAQNGDILVRNDENVVYRLVQL